MANKENPHLFPVKFVIASKTSSTGTVNKFQLKARYDAEQSIVVPDGGFNIAGMQNIVEMHIELVDGRKYLVDWVDLENGKRGLGIFKDEDVRY